MSSSSGTASTSSDPSFKTWLQDRRKKQKLAKERAWLSRLPNLKDAAYVQKFFLKEIQCGERLLGSMWPNQILCVDSFSRCCKCLQLMLPPTVPIALTKLPTINQRIVIAENLAEDDSNKLVINKIRSVICYMI
ncbi:mitochondrial import receptor subunit TOM20 homolog [Mesocricetus auratus]|uniref:Mitochondrial import receptor subunit TOM20 homolog n=1 Tax=Mesocricetus auratus TaxID=10036 RepID=A0ABM2X8Z3_MESAU|nr:mitochondrial import receptor subunit TOM20 homolog [Mesocricetus auratus]